MDLKTVFMIVVTTSRMVFPGLPATVPFGEAPKTAVIPASRSITMEVYSDAKAKGSSTASATVPSGLEVANPVTFLVDPRGVVQRPAASASDFVVKTYWGSSETVPEGQPRKTSSSQTASTTAAAAYPTASYAYWPKDDAKPLNSDASAVGDYVLTTDYAGTASVTLDQGQEFLPAIHLTNVRTKTDQEKPVKLTWKPVANALAILVTVTGGNRSETICWTSSADPDAAVGIEDRPVLKDELDKLVQEGVLMPPTATTCTIPAGIFKGSSSVFVTVTAFGGDKVETKDGAETRVMVRSVVSAPVIGTSYKAPPETSPEDEDSASSPPPPPFSAP